MAKKNYSKMSTENVKKEDIQESLDPIVETVEVTEVVEEAAVEPVLEPKKKIEKGAVCDCVKLNVRENSNINATIKLTINKGTVVEINDSEGDFYHVSGKTASGEFAGYCMKKFIKIKN